MQGGNAATNAYRDGGGQVAQNVSADSGYPALAPFALVLQVNRDAVEPGIRPGSQEVRGYVAEGEDDHAALSSSVIPRSRQITSHH